MDEKKIQASGGIVPSNYFVEGGRFHYIHMCVCVYIITLLTKLIKIFLKTISSFKRRIKLVELRIVGQEIQFLQGTAFLGEQLKVQNFLYQPPPPKPPPTTMLCNKIKFLYNKSYGYQNFYWKNSVRYKQNLCARKRL